MSDTPLGGAPPSSGGGLFDDAWTEFPSGFSLFSEGAGVDMGTPGGAISSFLGTPGAGPLRDIAGGAPPLPSPPTPPLLGLPVQRPPPDAAPAAPAPAPAVAKEPAPAAGKKRSRSKAPPDAAELKARRARHNEVEIRRRKKIAVKFDELRVLTGCNSQNKGGVLACAVDAIEHYKATLAALTEGKEAPAKPTPKCGTWADGIVVAASSSASSGSQSPSRRSEHTPTGSVRADDDPNVARAHALAVRFNISGWFDALFCHMSVAMMMNTLNGQCVNANQAFVDLMCYEHAEMTREGSGLFSITSPESLPATFAMVERLMNGHISSAEIVKTFVRGDGKKFTARCFVSLISDDENDPKLILSQVVPLSGGSHGKFGSNGGGGAAAAAAAAAEAEEGGDEPAGDAKRARH